MRKHILFIFLASTLASCGTTHREVSFNPPFQPQTSPLEQKILGGGSQELPISPPVNPKKLDLCTRYLLFADQYITASDYPDASDEINKARRYCTPNDPRLLYMEAVMADINENKKKAYRLYYKAAKGYIKRGDLNSAFKCYSGMISINPDGKEVKELKPYFEDENY